MSFYDAFSEKELALLRLRAERTAQVAQGEQDDNLFIDVLGIQVGGEDYALPLDMLTAAYQVDVNLVSPIVPVPCTPPFIAGIVNIRGHVVPVIDLGVLLSLPQDAMDAGALVAVANDQMTVAFQVSTIGDPRTLPISAFIPIPDSFSLAKKEYIRGTLTDGTSLLNIEALLGDPALIINEQL